LYGFYNLTRNPFEISPDPYFYYATERHNEALAILIYAAVRRKGFVVVTGEVGTGKTLLVRCLLQALHRNQIEVAFIFNPILPVVEFLSQVLTDLGLPSPGSTKSEMLSQLNNYLLARESRGRTTALVVDEAQLLSCELLEEIRLLTNLETTQHKLLQIVLVGQPELDQKLDSPELRQLKQRIGMRCRLEPLGPEQVRGYIQRRLELAGANSHATTLFSEGAIAAILRFSRGIPRLVNILCENALISGYGSQSKQITPDMVAEAAADLCIDEMIVSSTSELDDFGGPNGLMRAVPHGEELERASQRQPDEAKSQSGAQ
jgi:type II secretory pathway predicted ATPase ExeA